MSSNTPEEVPEGFVAVGRVLGPWGVRGAVKVAPLTDFPERLKAKQRLFLRGEATVVQESRLRKGDVVMKLAGIESREAAEELRGALLTIPEAELMPLPAGDYYRFQIVGLQVTTIGGEPFGQVVDIMETGSNDVFVVATPRGEVLVPATDDVVQAIDLEAGQMIIEVVEGLL